MRTSGILVVLFVALLACCMPVQGAASLTMTSTPPLLSAGDDITITISAVDNNHVITPYWVETNVYLDPNIIVSKKAAGCEEVATSRYYCDDIWTNQVHYTFLGTVKPGTAPGTHLYSHAWSAFHYKDINIPGPEIVEGDASSYVKTNAPEFPGLAVPVVMIIGILGAVFLVRRTREH